MVWLTVCLCYLVHSSRSPHFKMKLAKKSSRSNKLVRVGYYDLSDTLGKGNFAVVRLGTHRITKTRVAVKIVDKNELDAENLSKIWREIEIMRRLSYKHVIQLYEVLHTPGFIYIVTEFASNGEIFDFLVSNGKMSEKEAVVKFSQILKAVNYCHNRNVVHRDLKAENLLLDQDWNLKLADFGFSNYFKPGEYLSTWCGSPPYAAPELFEGREYDGPKTDIWSMGVILYALVSGSLPFDGQTLQDLRSRVVSGQFRIPFYLSTECESLIRSMLVVDPDKRLGIHQIIRHKWIRQGMGQDHASFLAEMQEISAMAESCLYNCDNFVAEQVASMLGVHPAVVRDSVIHNKCDHLSSVYHLIMYNAQHPDTEQGRDCPPLSPTLNQPAEYVTEVFNDTCDPHSAAVTDPPEVSNNTRSGRRHTLGPSGHPVALQPSHPLTFNFKEILPQTNLPQNLPLVSNYPFTDFSVKDQDLLRAPESLAVPPGRGYLGRRASDCGAYNALLAAKFYEKRSKETDVELSTAAEDNAFEGNITNRPRVLNYSTATECDETTQIERYLGGRGGGKRHTIACGGITAGQQLPESPRRRRTGLMTVMEKPPEIPAALLQEVESRIKPPHPRPLSPLNFLLNHIIDSPSSLPPLSPPPVSSPSKPPSLRQRRTGLSTVLETGKTLSGRSAVGKEPYSLHLPYDRVPLNRRLSEGAPVFSQYRSTAPPSLPSSTDQSPCEIKALQEEYMQLSKETRLSQDSGHSSSGYHSPQFLRPPSPPLSLTPSGSRRCSESNGIITEEENLLTRQHSLQQDDSMSALYEDMYASHEQKSRRFSFPNSPAHNIGKEKHSLTHHLQQLSLQQKLSDVTPTDNRIKGSITQGVPSLCATTPATTPSPGSTPKREVKVDSSTMDVPVLGFAFARTEAGAGLTGSDQISLEVPVDLSMDEFSRKEIGKPISELSEETSQEQSDFSGAQHPAICVTNVMGDEFKLVFNEPQPMEEN